MDATCTIQDSIHVFSLVHKYVSRILGTYQHGQGVFMSQSQKSLKIVFSVTGTSASDRPQKIRTIKCVRL